MREGWTHKPLGEVCKIICGQDYKSVQDANGLYPIYGTGGIMGYSTDFRCPAYSTIIGRKGSINNPLFVEEPFWNVDTAFGVVPNSKVLNPKYFFLFCKNYDFTIHDVSVTIPSLRRTDLLKIPVPIPSLSEQEHIVAELDLLTSIIDKQKQQLAELDTLAQSIFYDMFGNPVENERKWEITALNDVCSDITDGSHNPPKGGCKSAFMMLSSKNIFDGYYTIEEPRYLSKEEFATENKRTNLKCGDILLTIVGTIGRCCVFDGANQVALQRSVAVLKPKKSLVSIFLMKQLQALRAVLENEAKGVAQKGIYLNQLKRLNVILPPTSLQESFAEKISAIEQQKDTINRSIIESQKLFAYTMDKYFG